MTKDEAYLKVDDLNSIMKIENKFSCPISRQVCRKDCPAWKKAYVFTKSGDKAVEYVVEEGRCDSPMLVRD